VIYATWADVDDAGSGSIYVVRSDNGGESWTAPVRVAEPAPGAKVADVAVDGDGVVAVTWYEAGTADGTTRVMLALSRDGGQTWTARALSPDFDVTNAPTLNAAGGQQLGDYEGLVGLPTGGFVAASAVAGALSTDGATDVIGWRIRPGH